MSHIFSSQTLTEKLSQLNNSQQSIESLSHWCISHRKKAKHVVEIWGKLFNSSQKEQRVPLLYLANDILQNSRRKGSEFVNEFWKVLPGSLKLVYENGDDHGKKVVMRLVGIWVERKVFGSRGRGLKDDILGKVAPPVSDNNGKSANPIIVVKKDAHTVRIKLSIGAMPEKIITAYQSVLEENSSEDTLNKCRSAVEDVKKMEKDVDDACTRGIQQGSPLMGGIQEQEAILEQCIEQLESIEATRTTLVTQLKEALEEQESKLELIRRQLQIAQAEKDHAISIKQKLASATVINGIATTTTTNPPTAAAEPSLEPKPPIQTPTTAPLSFVNALSSPSPQPSQPPMISFLNSITGIPPQPPQQPGTSFANILTAEEENKKAAAAVAARLTASTSSAQMLASVLSSLAAEEAAAASMNGGGRLSSSTPPGFPPEKRPKLEKPMTANEMSATYFAHIPLPPPLPQAPNPNLQQTMSQANLQPPPPPPPPFPRPTGVQQFVPASGMMVGVGPFSFGGNGLPPPPPPLVSRTRTPQPPPSPPPPPLPPSLPPQQQQQQQQNSGFYQQPQMVGFYGPPLPPPRGSIASQGSST